jgi:hypothetical protein
MIFQEDQANFVATFVATLGIPDLQKWVCRRGIER